MLKIEFEYRDQFTHGGWSKQSCEMRSVEECIKWYGLGLDCEYRILSVKEIKD